MKSLPIIILHLFLIVQLHAQAPEGYYNQAQGLEGEDLKAQLHQIIKDHVVFPYTSFETDTWDILKESDKDTINPENVILFYTGWTVNAAQEYNYGDGWTREHVWPKGNGNFGTDPGAGTDAHNLRPSDNTVNQERSNKDFDFGGTIYIDGDGATECKTDSDSWEPRDVVKGDVARIVFYMAVRYEGDGEEPDLELVDQTGTWYMNKPGKGFHGKLSALLEWHRNDPVDAFEIRRNNIIYNYQKNRNPFIDHPEFAGLIWGNTSYVEADEEADVLIFPNPASDFIIISAPITGEITGTIFNSNGMCVRQFSISRNEKLDLSGLPGGIYVLQVNNKNLNFRRKIVISNHSHHS